MHILSVENISAREFGARINSNQVKRLALPFAARGGSPVT
jgi:hypothetical protein